MEMRQESKKREMEKERNGGKCGREVEKEDRYRRWQELVDLEAGIFEPTEEIWDSEKLRDVTDVVKLLNEQDKEIKTLTTLYDELNKKYVERLDKLLEVQEEHDNWRKLYNKKIEELSRVRKVLITLIWHIEHYCYPNGKCSLRLVSVLDEQVLRDIGIGYKDGKIVK